MLVLYALCLEMCDCPLFTKGTSGNARRMLAFGLLNVASWIRSFPAPGARGREAVALLLERGAAHAEDREGGRAKQ